ncbi:MAG: tyrosine--tRNA ligase [Pseudomonadota bacterium]|nr:tyrosine--tRNA ligase [Pseudomonadota bacterium]
MLKDFYDLISSRGFLHQSTDDNGIKKLLLKKTSGYIGFDCTSDSLHVGSLLPLMLLRAFQKCGHKPIILLGGGTTLIGDPSGKDETRRILQKKDILKNKKKLMRIFKKFLSFDSSLGNCAEILDNYMWLGNLKLISFLRDIGSKFSVNRMLGLDSIKQRLKREQNLSFLEFNYSIFQAYDFLLLHEKYNCMLQFGGSDQWGNIVSGIDLIKREKNQQVYGLTTPLVTNSSGKKMGKTSEGAVWLSEEKFSVQDFWQFWRNTSDNDIIKFLKLFTEISTKEIKRYENLEGSELNKLKIILANEVTTLCHGKEKSRKAESEAKSILSSKNFNTNIFDTCEQKLSIKIKSLKQGIFLKKILIDLKLTQSNGQSKRLIEQGAVKLNEQIVKEKDLLITKNDFTENPEKKNSYLIIYVGKKKYGVVELVS